MLGLQTYQTDIKILCRAYPAVKGGIFTELEIRGNALHISGYVNAVERESRVSIPARIRVDTKWFDTKNENFSFQSPHAYE